MLALLFLSVLLCCFCCNFLSFEALSCSFDFLTSVFLSVIVYRMLIVFGCFCCIFSLLRLFHVLLAYVFLSVIAYLMLIVYLMHRGGGWGLAPDSSAFCLLYCLSLVSLFVSCKSSSHPNP